MNIASITFLLAFIGYIGLAIHAILVSTGRPPRYLMVPVAPGGGCSYTYGVVVSV
jgi:hypothetical protein